MKRWKIRICNEAKKDYRKLDGSIRKQVVAGILKVAEAPLPSPNGYGKPLGNKNGNNLTGVVISERDDNYCYDLASKLYAKYGDRVFEDFFDNLI